MQGKSQESDLVLLDVMKISESLAAQKLRENNRFLSIQTLFFIQQGLERIYPRLDILSLSSARKSAFA